MSHLGRWLSALVDGELDAVERDRVLNHLAGCQPCLREANAMRALKRRLTALGETSADSAITGRLIELARSDTDFLGDAADLSPWPASPVRSPALRSRQIRESLRMQSWRMATTAAGTTLVAIAAVAFLLGSTQPEPPAPRITPSVDTYWLQYSYDSGTKPAARSGSVTPVTPAGPGSQRSGRPGGGPLGQFQASPTAPASTGQPAPAVATAAASPPGSVTQSPGSHVARHGTQ